MARWVRWFEMMTRFAVPLPPTDLLYFDAEMYRIESITEIDAVISDLEERYNETL